MTPEEARDFILGPQVPIGDTWFDRTLLAKGRLHGQSFPAEPPTGDALDAFINANYYDQGLVQAGIHRRTNNSEFLTYANKIADAWWKSPHIKEGTERVFDRFTYTPRNVSLGGLILRAINGRPEFWDWINAYTRAQFDAWLKIRINNTQLHLGVRDGAFMLQYATWLSQVLPDSFPLQSGGTATDGAQLRAQYLADVEAIAVNYFYRLQYMDGSWRWEDWDVNPALIGIMQPFMVGLLLAALCDAHQVMNDLNAKAKTQEMILDGCRHLYSGGPYSKQLVPHFNVNLRGFHYLYHGGTTAEPTKFENGEFPFDTTTDWHVSSARQAISTILPAFGYAYKISGDAFFKTAGDEMYDSAYVGTDGFRAMMDDTAKNFNQHARRGGSYLAWIGSSPSLPEPEPVPTQPQPSSPSPDGTKGSTVTDSQLAVWTLGAQKQTLKNGAQAGGGQGTIYKYLNEVVYVLGMDQNWYKWSNGWSSVGAAEPGVVQPDPQPDPEPEQPTPVPATLPRSVRWPNGLADQMTLILTQAQESYRPSGRQLPRPANMPKGNYVEFVSF